MRQSFPRDFGAFPNGEFRESRERNFELFRFFFPGADLKCRIHLTVTHFGVFDFGKDDLSGAFHEISGISRIMKIYRMTKILTEIAAFQ